MKLAIISDLHLKHWEHRTRRLNDPLPYQLVAESVAVEKPDVLIDAGDLEIPERLYEALDGILSKDRIIVNKGNHDYYGKKFDDDPLAACQSMVIDGVWFVVAPLWMDFNNFDPMTAMTVKRNLNDFRLIEGFTTRVCFDTHLKQKAFIQDRMHSIIDVIVTHHAPSFQSVHPRYKVGGLADLINYGFASKLDEMVFDSGAKLWVHGHTHDPSDYMIGKTRVVANPCGYPGERRGGDSYQPLYVEI